jgi:hypothetical protein
MVERIERVARVQKVNHYDFDKSFDAQGNGFDGEKKNRHISFQTLLKCTMDKDTETKSSAAYVVDINKTTPNLVKAVLTLLDK